MDDATLQKAPKIFKELFDDIATCETAHPWILEHVRAIASVAPSDDVKQFFEAIVEEEPEAETWINDAYQGGAEDDEPDEEGVEQRIEELIDETSAAQVLEAIDTWRRLHEVGYK